MDKIGPIPVKIVTSVAEFALTTIPHVAAPAFNSAMVKLIDTAIDGIGTFPSAKTLAAKQLQRKPDLNQAIDSIVRNHILLATAQGVVTNIGGIISTIIGTPINLTGLIFIQIRMVACIAHLHGYDVDDPRVRTAIAMCLLGEREMERQILNKQIPTTPLTVATSPVHDPGLHTHIADKVLAHLLTESAGKGLITSIARKTPVIGGGVGGIADLLDTRMVSICARKHLLIRRPIIPAII